MSGPALEARGVTRAFGAVKAVDGVDLEVAPASIFGLLGPNGSGKSTIIRMFCGLLRPSAGQVLVLGHDPLDRAHDVRRRIGYMSQRFSLYDDLTGGENLTFFARAHGIGAAERARRQAEVTDLLGLAPYLPRLAGTLSGGWKQRLALACALLHDPPVLFLDEPTAGIDPVARRALWSLLFELVTRGKTLFVTTHYMDEAERCDHLAYVYLGRLLVNGAPTELKHLPEVTPPGQARFVLDTERVTDVYRALIGQPGLEEVTVFGDSVHVLVSGPAGADELLRRLSPELRALVGVRPAIASLEDVFVTMTRRAAAEKTAAAGRA